VAWLRALPPGAQPRNEATAPRGPAQLSSDGNKRLHTCSAPNMTGSRANTQQEPEGDSQRGEVGERPHVRAPVRGQAAVEVVAAQVQLRELRECVRLVPRLRTEIERNSRRQQ
jgi:hypothetical protein